MNGEAVYSSCHDKKIHTVGGKSLAMIMTYFDLI